MVAFPLILLMGWSNSSPILCAPTKTIADLSNERLLLLLTSRPHILDTLALSLDRLVATTATAAGTTQITLSPKISVSPPTLPDPYLPHFQQHKNLHRMLMSLLMILYPLHKVPTVAYVRLGKHFSTP